MLASLTVNLSGDPAVARDLEAVVRSAVNEFTNIFPGCPPAGVRPIRVFYRPEGPKTDSTTNPNLYQIGLRVRDRAYAQLVFQLGHELCHIFADPRRTNWFVESCCEMASLLLLRRMAKAWARRPPFANWVNYAPRFQEYADNRVRQAAACVFESDSLPDRAQLQKWLTSVKQSFHEDPEDRRRNVIIAEMLRPFFEQCADNWDALRFLGQAFTPPPVDLTDGLLFSDFEFETWLDAVPEHLRDLVRTISHMFDNGAAANCG